MRIHNTLLFPFAIRYCPGFLNFNILKGRTHQTYTGKSVLFGQSYLTQSDYLRLNQLMEGKVPTNTLESEFAPLSLKLGYCLFRIQHVMGKPDYVLKQGELMRGYRILFYKKILAGLRCTFELHVHRGKLFLYRLNIHNSGLDPMGDAVIKAIFQGELTYEQNVGSPASLHLKDIRNQHVLIRQDYFNTHFLVCKPVGSSLKALIEKRLKDDSPESGPDPSIYRRLFLNSRN